MKYLTSLLVLLTFQTLLVAQEDCKGCSDYSILPRMPEFYIENFKEVEFDSQEFYFENKQNAIEGKKITINYRHSESTNGNGKFPTRLQILRNYSNAISEAGGTILFERPNAEHGYYQFNANNTKTWVKITTANVGNSYRLIIVEQQEMRQDVVITANLIKDKLELDGKITLEGIYFDLGKAAIKEESQPAISEIAKYLKENPNLNCWVVGHTSSEGSFEINSSLSLDRAKAIKNELEKEYNITKGRLFAEGVGPLAPLATNNTEEGKKLNRRVELVLK